MSFTRALLRLLPIFLITYVVVSLVLGYWDMSLSDHYLYQNQMARIHYHRTLLAHLILGIMTGIALALIFANHDFRKQIFSPTSATLKTQIPLSIALIFFLIIGIKIHLVWLDSHLLDPEGILWTLVALVSSALLFWILRSFLSLMFRYQLTRYLSAFLVLFLIAVTLQEGFARISAPRESSAEEKPNVLLIVIDTLRWDHVSSYNYPPKTTPSIDEFAREAVQYQTAISQSPWTTPSHAAIFTGQYPSRNGVDGRNIHLHRDNNTMAEVLARNGYQTAGFINNVYIRRQTGLAQGFQQYEEFWGRNEGSSLMLLIEFLQEKFRPRSDKGAAETSRALANWLDHDWNSKSPFFLFTHFMEPHAPYGSTKEYLQKFLPAGVQPDSAHRVNQDAELYICDKLNMTDGDFEILRSLYDSDIRYLDNIIGGLLELLRSRNLIDNTIVILTADHGENFGEHHLMSHELSVYDTLVRVPLLIRYPRNLPAGSKFENPVQLIDLFPTVLQILHINKEKLDLQGSNILPDASPGEFVFAEYNNSRAVDNIRRRFGEEIPSNPAYRAKILKVARSSEWKFIWGTDGTRELYAIRSDIYEKNNLFQSDSPHAQRMEQAVRNWVSSFKPSSYYRQEDISREALRELRSLGYIQ
jgi:arylsulfatase A-like enzyme